jgi:hypothetical protein
MRAYVLDPEAAPEPAPEPEPDSGPSAGPNWKAVGIGAAIVMEFSTNTGSSQEDWCWLGGGCQPRAGIQVLPRMRFSRADLITGARNEVSWVMLLAKDRFAGCF